MKRLFPLAALAFLIAALVALAALRSGSGPFPGTPPETRPVSAPPPASSADRAARRTPVVAVVEKIAPAVVNISAESIVRDVDPFFGQFFGSRSRRSQSLGSGFVIDKSGITVTNAHVVEGASKIVVTLLDGRELDADVLGFDHDADLAVLDIRGAKDLPAAPLGTSSDLMIGETVVAIGNPFGLSNSVTSGVLSARGRSVPSDSGERIFTDFLQTDASINPGNSGGPLVNVLGQVIGINTAIVSGANSVGFAIPADRARRIVDDLLRFGELRPLWTGLRLLTVDPELARRYDLGTARGALVYKVYPDSPAAQAGLAEGDLVGAVSGQPVAAREDVTTALYSLPAGRSLDLDVVRAGKPLKISLRPAQPPRDLGLRILEEQVGLTVELERDQVMVARVAGGSPAAKTGLRPGDTVLSVNGRDLKSLEALGEEVLRGFDRGGLPLVVGRGRYAYNLEFPF
ncbi:MAG TPA: trypsin-like peptidase domain-containing protein [Thermoanaerobaculia bacterium]|nr:trypsin-like peptidase domain-containing protein [Thermoanaerobaculia bacterium]